MVSKGTDENPPISAMVKRFGGDTYVFAVAMRNQEETATFGFNPKAGPAPSGLTAEVIGENRTIPVKDGAFGEFVDKFKGYEVHLYKISGMK
jgi:hypothetical protein